MRNIFRALASAKEEAKKSKCNYMVGAVVKRKHRTITRRHNTDKSHTVISESRHAKKYTRMHAEVRAVLATDRDILTRSTVYVARVTRHGTDALARPCLLCQEIMREAGVKKVYYTIEPGSFGMLDLRKETT
jgi:pyrimidine deaminase RibD-like protein